MLLAPFLSALCCDRQAAVRASFRQREAMMLGGGRGGTWDFSETLND